MYRNLMLPDYDARMLTVFPSLLNASRPGGHAYGKG